MNCYVCSLKGVASASVATCTHCGVAMCLEHLKDAQSHSVGGANYGCPHTLARAKAR